MRTSEPGFEGFQGWKDFVDLVWVFDVVWILFEKWGWECRGDGFLGFAIALERDGCQGIESLITAVDRS